MEKVNLIGNRISGIRKNKNLSGKELSERSGLPEKMIENIESGVVIPSLGHLIKVARALGVRLGTFVDDAEELGPVISRNGESKSSGDFSTSNNAGSALLFHPLAGDKSNRHFEPFLIDVAGGKDTPIHLSAHEGEEFIYVLNGDIEISYGKEKYQLATGDSIFYDSIIPHHVHAAGDVPARILAVVYAPF